MTKAQQKKLLMEFAKWLRENHETFDLAYKDEGYGGLDMEYIASEVDRFLESLTLEGYTV
jgi:hypothetical protein